MGKDPVPTDADRVQVVQLALGGIAGGVDVVELARELSPWSRRKSLFPGDVLIALAADALTEADVSRDRPLQFSGIRERFLPERPFSGNTEHQKSQAVLRAAAMVHAGFDMDLLEEAGWWRVNDFWLYAFFALVIYTRAGAERLGEPLTAVCDRIAARHGVALSADAD